MDWPLILYLVAFLISTTFALFGLPTVRKQIRQRFPGLNKFVNVYSVSSSLVVAVIFWYYFVCDLAKDIALDGRVTEVESQLSVLSQGPSTQKELSEEIKKMQLEVENQKWERAAKFSNYCHFNGGVSFTSNDSAIATLMRSSMVPLGDGKYNIQCAGEVVSDLEKVIEIEPTCPYPYFHLAYCYKQSNNTLWEKNALKAKDILENTTKVKGRNMNHDKLLKQVIDMLSGIL